MQDHESALKVMIDQQSFRTRQNRTKQLLSGGVGKAKAEPNLMQQLRISRPTPPEPNLMHQLSVSRPTPPEREAVRPWGEPIQTDRRQFQSHGNSQRGMDDLRPSTQYDFSRARESGWNRPEPERFTRYQSSRRFDPREARRYDESSSDDDNARFHRNSHRNRGGDYWSDSSDESRRSKRSRSSRKRSISRRKKPAPYDVSDDDDEQDESLNAIQKKIIISTIRDYCPKNMNDIVYEDIISQMDQLHKNGFHLPEGYDNTKHNMSDNENTTI